jgi:hypothetical protein
MGFLGALFGRTEKSDPPAQLTDRARLAQIESELFKDAEPDYNRKHRNHSQLVHQQLQIPVAAYGANGLNTVTGQRVESAELAKSARELAAAKARRNALWSERATLRFKLKLIL